MKTLKIATIATIITVAIIALCGIATASAETYEMTAVVTEWEQIGETDLYNITVTDANGNMWGFMGEKEDAHIGNLYRVTMMDLSNEHEEDDEIADAELLGILTPVQVARFLKW